MTDFSDTEADFNPNDPADLAILNMDLASADTRVAEWLAHCGGDPVKAFSYDWLSVNSDVLWLKRKLHANFDDHVPSLLKVVDSIDTWTIDADTIQDWTQKTKDFWVDANGKYRRHQALLLCYGRNRCGLQPPGDDGLVFSGVVVWVLRDQSRVTVPEAIQHLMATAVPQREETAVLCSIPETAPYWVSPEDVNECNLVQLNNNIGTWATYLNRVHCYRCITFHLQSMMRSFVALSRWVCGRKDIKADTVAFYYIEPRGALWPCTAYAVTNNSGDLLPALNVIPLDTGDDMAPAPPPIPPHTQYPPPNPALEQDVIQMMGPTVGQLEHYIINDSSDTTQQPNTGPPIPEPRTPEGAPRPAPPGIPPPPIIVKKEQMAQIPESFVDGPNVSTSLKQTHPDTEEGAASDTTFNESVDSGAPPAVPPDHTYTSIGIQAPDSTNPGTQQPSSSTSGPPPIPSNVPSQNVATLADDEGRIASLCSLPQEIIQHSAVLDAAYDDLMTRFFDKLRVTHAERLCNLNTCRASVNKAIREWTSEVHNRSCKLGSNPGTVTYNVAVDTVRLLSNTLRKAVNDAENKFLESRRSHDAQVEENAAEVKEMLCSGIRDAIQVFLQECMRSCINYVGVERNLDPWLAQFSAHTMDFQSRILARTAEFYNLPMELRTAAVLQQLDMFISTARMLPVTCPLSYPVPTPRALVVLPPTSASGTVKGTGTKMSSGTVGGSSAESSNKGKTGPIPAPRATTALCRGDGVSGSTALSHRDATSSMNQSRSAVSAMSASSMPLRDVPGSYSYTSIITRGFTPSSQERLPVAEKATRFGVLTPPAISRVAGSRAPTMLIQTVAPSATTVTVTSAASTTTQGSGVPRNPIDCRPLGAKRPHNPSMGKGAAPPPEIIMLDHQPDPIPIVTLDDDNSDPNKLTINTQQSEEKSPIAIPEKRARVGGSPAMAKGITAAGAEIGLAVVKKSQAEAAAKAFADNTLGSLSSSSDDSDTPNPATATVTKSQKKRKSKKERDNAKSQAQAPSSSDDDGGNAVNKHTSNVEGLCSSLNRGAIIDSIHEKARNADFDFIQQLRQKYGLPSTGMTQDDISHFLPFITDYRAQHMKDPSLWKKHIWSIDEAIEAMETNLTQPKMDKNKLARTQWKRALRQLNEYKNTVPMPESQEFKGVQPRVYAKFITRIFIKSDSKSNGRPLSNNTKMVGDEYKRVVLGLSKLHRNKAISRRQERDVDGGSICAFCCLCFSNHESANNHIRVHWRMALMCALCSRVEVDAHEMIHHGCEEHGLQVP